MWGSCFATHTITACSTVATCSPTPKTRANAVVTSSTTTRGSAPANRIGRWSEAWITCPSSSGCSSVMQRPKSWPPRLDQRPDEGERAHDVGGADHDGDPHDRLADAPRAVLVARERPHDPTQGERQPSEDARRRA